MLLPKTRHNLRHGYGYSALAFLGVTSLWVIFLQQRGLSLVEIGLCESVFHLTSLLSEVPSGILADRFGYRTMLISSRIMALVHAVLMLTVTSLPLILLAFVLQAWAYNLQSGTLEAALYDTLVSDQATEQYPQVTKRLNITIELGDTLGILLAGWLLPHHLAVTYWLAIAAAIGAIIIISQFKVSRSTAVPVESTPAITAILQNAVQALAKTPQLRALMVFHGIFAAVGTTYYYYFQTVMTAHHFSGSLITGILIAGAGLNVLGIQLTPWLQQHRAQRQLLWQLSVVLVLALISTFFQAIALLVSIYLLINILMAMIEPLLSNYYNQLIPSDQRATLLSVASMLFSLAMIVLFPVIGWLIELVGFTTTFGSLGGLGLIAGWLIFKTKLAASH
ncbi:MFS transporter [Lactiplantibacillus herbarum]|uniref:MFS transporter n=1 Tax=Lactiplantibacillus herbarum TaxID=1670446 RepID=UPI00064E1EEA|nr:MFS transporter [Lactiplantibacillus herbarum]